MALWLYKLLKLIFIRNKNVITSCSINIVLFLHLEVKPLMTLTTVLYFLFQAEDGIRDYKVTGVQTCALPISIDIGQVGIIDVVAAFLGLGLAAALGGGLGSGGGAGGCLGRRLLGSGRLLFGLGGGVVAFRCLLSAALGGRRGEQLVGHCFWFGFGLCFHVGIFLCFGRRCGALRSCSGLGRG